MAPATHGRRRHASEAGGDDDCSGGLDVVSVQQYGSALHVANGSQACLVWFGGLHEPFLNPDFLTSQRGLILDGLFLRDDRFDWYTGGFESLADDFPASLVWLENFRREHRYESLFIGGQSSGGYAAMRVARRILPAAVIAFSPQTRNIVNRHGLKQPPIDLEDLAVAYADWDAGFPIYIHLARSEKENEKEFFWDDWEQIRPFLEKDNVTVIRHPFDTHVVSLRLYGLGRFYETILSDVMLHMPYTGPGSSDRPSVNDGSRGRRAFDASGQIKPGLVMLPASQYAKYSVPVDAAPSRDLRPRWGNTRPLIPALNDRVRACAPNYEAFLDEMRRSAPALASLPREFAAERLPQPAWFGVPMTPLDALAIYTMVRVERPATCIAMGTRIGLCFAIQAVRDHGLATRIVVIDPEPNPAIAAACDEVVREGLETCDLARFDELRAGDIILFHGSHRSFMNSDVTVFMIDVLPRLQPGVIVHMHDVMLPWDYPDMFVDWYWNEQYLLAAYMIAGGDRVEPLFPTTFICRDPRFAARLQRPFIDFGDAGLNEGWRYGGSMWFTHRADRLAPGDAAETAKAEADLAQRIQRLRELAGSELAGMNLPLLTEEVRDILEDPIFQGWAVAKQLPMIERIYAIYTWCFHASGHSLIPTIERLFYRALATPGVALDALCLFYDLFYFLYWYTADSPIAMRGVADSVMKPFAAAIRDGNVRGLPTIVQRPVGREPLRLGYLSQFAHLGPGNAIGPFIQHVLGGLSRQLPGHYRLVLYAWMYYDDAALAPLEGSDILVRRFDADTMSERIAAVAKAIAEDQIDVLITDMNSSLPTVLFERRAAPVQIFHQLGLPFWPLANIDAVFCADSSNYVSEIAGFNLENCFTTWLGRWDLAALAPDVDPARVAAERARFAPEARLIGNYGRLAKITPDFLDIVAELLAQHPRLVVLLGGTGDPSMIEKFIIDRGLAGRLVLDARYVDGHLWGHLLEVFLDTFPQGGGISCQEVFAKALPAVTISGDGSEDEYAWVPMLVAGNRAEYVSIVSRLIEDRGFYETVCAATRNFVAAQPREADYAATIHDLISTVVGRVLSRS